jgi:hypothetical protein
MGTLQNIGPNLFLGDYAVAVDTAKGPVNAPFTGTKKPKVVAKAASVATGRLCYVKKKSGASVRTHPQGLVRGQLGYKKLFVRVGPQSKGWVWGYAYGKVHMAGWVMESRLHETKKKHRMPGPAHEPRMLQKAFRIVYVGAKDKKYNLDHETHHATYTTKIERKKANGSFVPAFVYENYTSAKKFVGETAVPASVHSLNWRYSFDGHAILVFYDNKWMFSRREYLDPKSFEDRMRELLRRKLKGESHGKLKGHKLEHRVNQLLPKYTGPGHSKKY